RSGCRWGPAAPSPVAPEAARFPGVTGVQHLVIRGIGVHEVSGERCGLHDFPATGDGCVVPHGDVDAADERLVGRLVLTRWASPPLAVPLQLGSAVLALLSGEDWRGPQLGDDGGLHGRCLRGHVRSHTRSLTGRQPLVNMRASATEPAVLDWSG